MNKNNVGQFDNIDKADDGLYIIFKKKKVMRGK